MRRLTIRTGLFLLLVNATLAPAVEFQAPNHHGFIRSRLVGGFCICRTLTTTV